MKMWTTLMQGHCSQQVSVVPANPSRYYDPYYHNLYKHQFGITRHQTINLET